jgi:RNA polymerase sigma-70 factor (ECF subfamily)
MSTNNNLSTSATLLARLRDSRDWRSWQKFYKRYVPQVQAWCRRRGLSHQDVDDVTGAVLLSVAKAMPNFTYDPAQGFRKWLKTVVMNCINDYFRTRARRPGDRAAGGSEVYEQLLEQPEVIDELVTTLSEPLDAYLLRVRQEIASVQASVNPQQWEAFWMTAVEEKPTAAVAAQLEMKYAAVAMAKYRVKKQLVERLQELENADN